jgi:diguanylate cyclase (GGDEF)-like protein
MTNQEQVRGDGVVESVAKLWNRGHGADRLTAEIARAAEDANYQFSILLVQFDGLTSVTNRLGHASDQDVWRRVLAALNQDLGADDVCCRLGGDEFMLILPQKGEVACRAAGERIRQRWMPRPDGREAALEMSIGFASYPGDGATIEVLLMTADETMDADRQRNEGMRSAEGMRLAPQ